MPSNSIFLSDQWGMTASVENIAVHWIVHEFTEYIPVTSTILYGKSHQFSFSVVQMTGIDSMQL